MLYNKMVIKYDYNAVEFANSERTKYKWEFLIYLSK